MKTSTRTGMIIVALAATAAIAVWQFMGSGNPPSSGKAQKPQTAAHPTVRVKTAPLSKKTIREQIFVYGSVVPAPGALQTVSVPYESRILAIAVDQGQRVSKGDTLLHIRPSPSTRLEFDQARKKYELEKENLQQVKHQYQLRLATNQQLLQAKQSFRQAELTLKSLQNRGIDGKQRIASKIRGLVKQVSVREGSIVGAGNTLVEIVARDRLQVRLGVEPENLGSVHTGQDVVLTRINAPIARKTSGKIREISYAVNPSTRLIDIYITLDSSDGYLLNESIAGQLAIASAEGFVVPRSAVLPEGDKHVLYTVKNGRAVKHFVRIGLENPHQYQVSAKDLQAGDPVVVQGNYELADGMHVSVAGAGK